MLELVAEEIDLAQLTRAKPLVRIAGIHEVLRRQGLLAGTWCLDPRQGLSAGQLCELDRVHAAYPHLNDDDFVAEHRDEWLSGRHSRLTAPCQIGMTFCRTNHDPNMSVAANRRPIVGRDRITLMLTDGYSLAAASDFMSVAGQALSRRAQRSRHHGLSLDNDGSRRQDHMRPATAVGSRCTVERIRRT